MDGKIKVRGMTLVEVVVATALFAIFLCLSLGLWQMASVQESRLERRYAARRNVEVMADFMKEEIGLAQSVCIFVDLDGDLGGGGAVDIRHPNHNKNGEVLIPTEAMKLVKLIFEYNTPRQQTLFVNHGEMTFQGQQVGDSLACIWVVCDETGKLVTFTVEGALDKWGEQPAVVQFTECMSYKK